MNRPLPAVKITVETADRAGSEVRKVPTVDGNRIEFDEINVGDSGEETPVTDGSWFHRARATLSLFLAGMYTGIGCSGVPHSHHTYSHDRDKGPL